MKLVPILSAVVVAAGRMIPRRWVSATVALTLAGTAGIFPARAETPVAASSASSVKPENASATYRSPRFGWSIDLSGTQWNHAWPTLAHDIPAAEWGTLIEDEYGCCCVIPVWISRDAVDFEVLVQALADRLGVDPTGRGVSQVRPWENGPVPGGRGRSFTWEGAKNGFEVIIHFRVLALADRAFLVAAWCDKGHPEHLPQLDTALDSFRCSPYAETSEPPEVAAKWWKENTLRGHKPVFNTIGAKLRKAGRGAEAAKWLEAAYRLDPDDAGALVTYARTLLDSGQKAAALKLVEGEVPKHPHASPLLILAAELRTSSGDIGGGVKYYEQLFDSGYRDDEVFRTFVLNAIEVRQWRVAETALQKYAMGHDSPRISMLKGFVAQMQGRYSEAIVAYRAHLARHPDDPEVLQLLAVCAIRVKRFADSITICNKLIAAKQVNAGVYRTLGYAHSGLQEWAEAKTAFQRSLEMEPENTQAREMMHLLEQK